MLITSIFPSRYVQGAGALASLPEEIERLGGRGLGVVDRLVSGLIAGTGLSGEVFGGECCDEEIARYVALARERDAKVIFGIGGGKAADTAKAAAHELGLPVAVVPTLASTDAPCSALSVIYTAQGAFKRYLVLPRNPDLVLIDTQVVANAPVRFLVSGMGDALSTWFEANDCQIKHAANMTGRPGGFSSYALARLCYDTLMEYGLAAKRACEAHVATDALERIVEANTLLSGLGFESGGLSGAHAIHDGLTVLEQTHRFWHGEKVAIGTQALLQLTGRPPAVVDEVYNFCTAIGLPTTLADIGLAEVSDADLMRAAEATCAPGETIGNCPCAVSPATVFAALKAADAEGRARKAA